MSLCRHREIYRSDVIRLVRERRKRRPRPHRLDEFPAGYSSAGCSPAEPASASPAVDHSALQSSCQSMAFHRTANSVLTVCLSPGARLRVRLAPSDKPASRIRPQATGGLSVCARRTYQSSNSPTDKLPSVPTCGQEKKSANTNFGNRKASDGP